MADAIIIGKGPAGITAAFYLLRAGFDVDIIGQNNGALSKADKIDNYYGILEPISGNELIETGIKQAIRFGGRVYTDEVVGISFEDKLTVHTKNTSHKGDVVIIATGSSRPAPNIKGLKEFEGSGVSFCAICDAFFYRNKAVGVIGNGEYALHEIKELSSATDNITLFTNGKELEAEFPSNIKIETGKIIEIAGDERVSTVKLADKDVRVDGVFVAVGVAGSADLAKKLGLSLNGNKIVVDDKQFTGNPGIFAAGDCTGGLLQIAVATGEGAVAGTSAVNYLRSLRKKA